MTPNSKTRVVEVAAPCRLHFGLINCGAESPDQKSFGGIGAMIDQPSIEVQMEAHDQLEIRGDNGPRVRQFAKLWFESVGKNSLASDAGSLENLPVKISCRSPRNHIGLGIGTQLAMAVATGLCRYFETATEPDELARLLGRGTRSAVGIQGFQSGGFIFESGKSVSDQLGKLEFQQSIPENWHAVLIINDETVGMHGAVEDDVFRNPIQDTNISGQLEKIITDQIVPALQSEEFDLFSKAIFEYGKLSGSLFAEQQGGAYNGPVVEKAVEMTRSLGIEGVGQSSWGPTVFAITESLEKANDLLAQLEPRLPGYQFVVSAFNRGGAKFTIVER